MTSTTAPALAPYATRAERLASIPTLEDTAREIATRPNYGPAIASAPVQTDAARERIARLSRIADALNIRDWRAVVRHGLAN